MQKGWYLIIFLTLVIIVLLAVLILVPSKILAPSEGKTVSGGLTVNLASNAEISSPLKITGSVSGNGWSGFEGQVGAVKLLDNSGNELAQGALKAATDWTVLPTNFEADLSWQSASSRSGTLIFHNENPSGDPAKDETFSLPIIIK